MNDEKKELSNKQKANNLANASTDQFIEQDLGIPHTTNLAIAQIYASLAIVDAIKSLESTIETIGRKV